MKKVSYLLIALFGLMLCFTACSNVNEPEGKDPETGDKPQVSEGNMKRVAAAFYYGEDLFPGMPRFSLRFTTGTLDLSQDPIVGTGDVVVLDLFSECQEGLIFPKTGEYKIVDMEKVENGDAMAGADYMGTKLGCYLMFAEDGKTVAAVDRTIYPDKSFPRPMTGYHSPARQYEVPFHQTFYAVDWG